MSMQSIFQVQSKYILLLLHGDQFAPSYHQLSSELASKKSPNRLFSFTLTPAAESQLSFQKTLLNWDFHPVSSSAPAQCLPDIPRTIIPAYLSTLTLTPPFSLPAHTNQRPAYILHCSLDSFKSFFTCHFPNASFTHIHVHTCTIFLTLFTRNFSTY